MTRRDAVVWLAVGLVVSASIAVGAWAGTEQLAAEPADLLLFFLPAFFAALGAIIYSKADGNPIGLLLLWMAISLLITFAATQRLELIEPDQATIADALTVIWTNVGEWLSVFLPFCLLMHILPTGHFINPRWRWAGWAAGISASTFLFAEVSAREVTPIGPQHTWSIPNPIGFMDGASMTVFPFGIILAATFPTLLLGGIVAIIVRARRSGPIVRAQLKWVGFSLILFVVVGLLPAITFEAYGANLIITILLVPISMALAITRYRLFEIDRILSRTVAYVLLVAFLAFVYFAGAVWLPTQMIGEESPVFVAAATLVVAALFNPARRRVVEWVDRRFNRSRYDADRVVTGFRDRLSEEVSLQRLEEDSLGIVEQTVQPSSVGIWIRD